MKKLIPNSHPFRALKNRKLLYQISNQKLIDSENFTDLLPIKGTSAYIGVDPTAESIHLGNLVGFVALNHLRLSGFKPIVVLGGATAHIGDPSGRTKSRDQVLQEQTIEHNTQMFRQQFQNIFNNIDAYLNERYEFKEKMEEIQMVNNYDFYKEMTVLDYFRNIGHHFRLGPMLSRESVKTRMESSDDGMSFTEFSYQTFQSNDFYMLKKLYNCRVQIGGSDQWGNIIGGCDLIKRAFQEEAFAVTFPLLVDSTGQKFGKSAGNAIWMDPSKTKPYDLYQYFFNITDNDVEDLLYKITFLSHEQIEEVMTEHNKLPDNRVAQKELAKNMILIVHGQSAYNEIMNQIKAFQAVRNQSEIFKMGKEAFEEYFKDTKKHLIHGKDLADLIVKTGMRQTRSEARRTMKAKGVQMNGVVIEEDKVIDPEKDLLHGKYIIVKVGKKDFAVIEYQNQ